MLGIKLAKEMLDASKKKYELANKHKREQDAVRKSIGEKRKKMLDRFVSNSKKPKTL